MATAKKRKLSGSTDGKGILIATTATLGTTIHTAVAGTTAGTFDEVWIWLYNGHTADVVTTIEYGGAVVPTNNIVLTVPTKAGLTLAVPGLILQNALVVTCFAATINVITASGFVNTLTD